MPAPPGMAAALRARIAGSPGAEPLTLATVHLFSMHTFQLRMWLRAGGVDPDREVRIIVLPPEQMCDSLARGIIDGFCVGEPWNTLAVQQGIGAVAATGYEIWNNAPEKVLGVTEAWHNHHPATHLRLRIAIMAACQALADPAQRELAAQILSQAQYLGSAGKGAAALADGQVQPRQAPRSDGCAGFSCLRPLLRRLPVALAGAMDGQAAAARCWARTSARSNAARWCSNPGGPTSTAKRHAISGCPHPRAMPGPRDCTPGAGSSSPASCSAPT